MICLWQQVGSYTDKPAGDPSPKLALGLIEQNYEKEYGFVGRTLIR